MHINNNADTIFIGNYTASYDKFISDINMEYIADLAAEALKKHPEPLKAAKFLINSSTFKKLFWNLPDFVPYDEDSEDLPYNAGSAFILSQIIMCFTIAYIAGLSPSDNKVRTFILSKFHNKTVSTTLATPESEYSERVIFGVLHIAGNIVSTEHIGRSACKCFFKKCKRFNPSPAHTHSRAAQ